MTALTLIFAVFAMIGGGDQISLPLVQVRAHYLEAVHEESAIERGMAAVEAARTSLYAREEGLEEVDPADVAVLNAYEGAFITLKAKHGLWPPARLRHLRDGLKILDQSVADAPHQPEIRYLRLLSSYFLPGILGMGQSVDEDFAALAELLPTAAGNYPPELYRTMVRFVLENGDPEPRQRAALEAVLPPDLDR